MLIAYLFVLSFCCFFLGNVFSGGAGLFLLVAGGVFLPSKELLPAIAIAGTISGAHRVWIYRKSITFNHLKKFIPTTIAGASIGAYIFCAILKSGDVTLLSTIASVMIVVAGLYGLSRQGKVSIAQNNLSSMLIGFFSSMLSATAGASGPLMNVGLKSFSYSAVEFMALKSSINLILQATKVAAFAVFSALSESQASSQLISVDLLPIAFACSLGFTLGNICAHVFLRRSELSAHQRALDIGLVFIGLLSLSQSL